MKRMRMIDALELKRSIAASAVVEDGKHIFDIIDEQPTIEPERKTGRWIEGKGANVGFWICSCCKFPSEAFAANVLYKFCPRCGAKMEADT